MATVSEWNEVVSSFDRLEKYRSLQPTLAAMRRLIPMIQGDPSFDSIHPYASHAAIVLAKDSAQRRVWIWWFEGDQYKIAFVDQELRSSEETLASQDVVLDVLREYVNRLLSP